MMKKIAFGLAALLVSAVCMPSPAEAGVRIKDVASFEGVRQNQLVGYGLVVGLNGTGDSLRNSPFTKESLGSMLEKMGVGVEGADMKTKNAAAVMVTAKLPPFARKGATIDVSVSSMGDATSLQGGTLMITSLRGADSEIYAVAQGPVTVGGYAVKGRDGSVTEGVPTTGSLAGGAVVEREVNFDLRELDKVRIALRNPDFTTASRVAEAINDKLGLPVATMTDPGTVEVQTPPALDGRVPQMMAQIENLEITPDGKAKVVIDSKSGTIVIGDKVKIDRVAVSQGGLTVKIAENQEVSQPDPLSDGLTVAMNETNIQITEDDAKFVVLDEPVTLQDLVDGLNAIGVGARETISILQAIKASGALHAELEVR